MAVNCMNICFSARMEQMKLRHLEEFAPRAQHIPPPQGTLTHIHRHIFNIVDILSKAFHVLCRAVQYSIKLKLQYFFSAI